MYIMMLPLLPISFSCVNIGIKHVFSSLKVFARFQGRESVCVCVWGGGGGKNQGQSANKAKLLHTIKIEILQA